MPEVHPHTNRLVHETSPYLRQHAHNPVDWYPWGDEALQRARAESRPILLSIGYAACHWCHVMERESFEDEDTARLMNEYFVCIKVDREERPDLDTIYMQATQLMSGHGGWPMTVFLTPEGVPYYAGTYFPPEPRHGMPSFRQLLASMADAWKRRREDVEDNARRMREALEKMASMEGPEQPLSRTVLDTAAAEVARRFDSRHGGFGGAPKFPQSMTMSMLLRDYARSRSPRSLQMVTFTLEKMARGGIYDQLGGGFARYSVDDRWLVPHFEKMLYDNALLTDLLVETWQATREDLYRRIACETIDYVLRDMTDGGGGFYATEDADSEGEEGKFYVWTPADVEQVLGDKRQAELVCAYYDVTPHGNFEHGWSILNVPLDADVVAARVGVKTAELTAVVEQARPRLFEARSRRVRPGRDEKIISAWNGLMLHAVARAGAVFERDDYLEAGRRNAAFVLDTLWVDGRVMRVHKDGQTKLNGYLEDYGALACGLLSLYEATFEGRWFQAARDIVDRMLELFRDEDRGGFFFTSSDHEQLITRFKDPYDNATPSGTSLAVTALLRLWALTGEQSYREPAEQALAQMQDFMLKAPTGFGMLLCALDFATAEVAEIAVVGSPDDARTQALRRAIWGPLAPNKVVAGMAPGEDPVVPLLEGKTQAPAVYVCRNFTCEAPITDPDRLRL